MSEQEKPDLASKLFEVIFHNFPGLSEDERQSCHADWLLFNADRPDEIEEEEVTGVRLGFYMGWTKAWRKAKSIKEREE